MEVSIAIDQGNSRAKVAIFAGEQLVELRHYEPLSIGDIEDIAVRFSVQRAIYSSVRMGDEAIAAAISRISAKVIKLDHLTPMPIAIDYATPATLGHDRIADYGFQQIYVLRVLVYLFLNGVCKRIHRFRRRVLCIRRVGRYCRSLIDNLLCT